MKPLTIANHFVVAAIHGAASQGLPISFILEGTGIPPELLNQDKARVSPEQFVLLIQRIWHILEDELMGFGPVKSKLGSFATMCQLAIHSENLEQMLKRGARFYSLFELVPAIRLEIHGSRARLVLQNDALPKDKDFFIQETLLVIWHRTACWMIDQRINLSTASFNYPAPDHQEEYKSIFYCPIEFNAQETYLEFNADMLKQPIRQDERTLSNFLQSSPADLLARPTKDESYSGKIRSLIGREIHGELPSFADIAKQLFMTPQTLRRRLKSENTSYQELKDNIRRDIAIYYLSQPSLGINDIASKVGFTEPSTFHRAFKKWTGVTPLAYRQQHKNL
jgi:AraC-like DNA-binding protein